MRICLCDWHPTHIFLTLGLVDRAGLAGRIGHLLCWACRGRRVRTIRKPSVSFSRGCPACVVEPPRPSRLGHIRLHVDIRWTTDQSDCIKSIWESSLSIFIFLFRNQVNIHHQSTSKWPRREHTNFRTFRGDLSRDGHKGVAPRALGPPATWRPRAMVRRSRWSGAIASKCLTKR